MRKMPMLDKDWKLLLKMLPSNWRELARSTNAVTRKLRNFENEESVLRALMLHIAEGYSLRETATRLKMANMANVSDVALLKRLQCSEVWFRELCLSLMQERGIISIKNNSSVRMRLIDGTTVKEPGKTGSRWRIHYSLILSDLKCDYFKLTATSGKGTWETFKHFPIQKGDCIIADRGYSLETGIAYVASKGGYSLVRVNTASLKFVTMDGKKFDLFQELQEVKREHETREWNVRLSTQGIIGRLCVVRKTQIAKEQAIKKMRQLASRRGTKTKSETEEFAGYVILFTTLPLDLYPLASVLEWYRVRWQIELVFKRLKSIAGLGHLPKHDDVSARAWLYGKLFTGLLVEKLIDYAKAISPWGYV